jgi:hypothetical protein
MAHALYSTDPDYALAMDFLTTQIKLKHKKHYKKICKSLSKLGYNEKVYEDEIQAYLSTEKKCDLIEDFDVDYDILKPYVLKYRKILRKSLDKFFIM